MDAFDDGDPLSDDIREQICRHIQETCTKTSGIVRPVSRQHGLIVTALFAVLFFTFYLGAIQPPDAEGTPMADAGFMAAIIICLLVMLFRTGLRRRNVVLWCYRTITAGIPRPFAGRLLMLAEANESEQRNRAESVLAELANAALSFEWDPYTRPANPLQHTFEIIKGIAGRQERKPPDGEMMLR